MRILQITASYKPAFVYGGPVMSVAKLCESLGVESDAQELRIKSQEVEESIIKESQRKDINQNSGKLPQPQSQPQPYFDSLPVRQAGAQQGKPQITVYTTLANGKEELPYKNGDVKIVNGVEVYYFKRITKDHSHLSPSFLWHLWKNVKQFDAVHIHAWWNLVSMGAAFICVLRGKSYILSPRGTLGNYSFHNRSSGVKNLFHSVIGRFLLKKAVFQVSSKKEQDDILKIISPAPPISIIPNFVELRKAGEVKRKAFDHSRFELLYFSRIEEKKGLEFLIESCARLSIPFHLTICGSGNLEYVAGLKKLAEQLGVVEKISWLGNIPVEKKFETLANYDLMILPSYDENFANVVIESLAVGTPVLLTPKVGLADYVEREQLGWIVKQEVAAISDKLNTIYMDEWDDLIDRGGRAPKVIQRDYDEDNLRNQYLDFYGGYCSSASKKN